MNLLDQAFIKAYTKDSSAAFGDSVQQGDGQKPTAEGPGVEPPDESVVADPRPAADSWHRVDGGSCQPAAIPAAHVSWRGAGQQTDAECGHRPTAAASETETIDMPNSWCLPPVLVMPPVLELPEPLPSPASPAANQQQAEQPQAEQQAEQRVEQQALPQASVVPTDRAAPAPPPQPAPEAEAAKFVPAWEVDRFCWPPLCEQLGQGEVESLSEAGQKLLAAVGKGLRVLAVTSVQRGEGRTTTALCLARCAAAAGARVALLDADFHNPQLGRALGLEATAGWQQTLADGLPLAEAAVGSLEDRLTLVPLTAAVAHPPLRLSDPPAAAMVRQLAAQFDLLLIDMEPTSAEAGPVAAIQQGCPIDAALLVRDLRNTPLEQTQAAAARLQAAGIETVAITENFTPRN